MTFSSAACSSWDEDAEWSGSDDSANVTPFIALTMRAHVVMRELSKLPFEAVYISEPSADGLGTTVFAVAHQSSDTLYEQLLDAQDLIALALPGDEIEFRIRESQGRPTAEAVPVWSAPIFLR